MHIALELPEDIAKHLENAWRLVESSFSRRVNRQSFKIMGYQQVTDAHLLGIALSHGARLATLDRSILDLVPPGFSPADSVYWLGGYSR